MPGTGSEAGTKPVVQPHLVRFLKERPRAIDFGLREEFLDTLEDNIAQRRRPDTMAEKTVQNFLRRFEETGGEMAKNKMRDRLENANERRLRNL